MTDPQPNHAPSAEPVPGIRWWAIAFGAVLALGMAAAAPWLSAWGGSGMTPFGGYLPILPLLSVIAMVLPHLISSPALATTVIAAGGAAMGLGLGLGFGLPVLPCILVPVVPVVVMLIGRNLRFRELLMVAAMLLVTTGAAGGGLATKWRDSVYARPAMAQDSNAKVFVEAYPQQMSLGLRTGDEKNTIDRTLDQTVRGGNPIRSQPADPAKNQDARFGLLPAADPAGAATGSAADVLAGPLLATGLVIMVGLLIAFALTAVTSRQWTQHERLPHPTMQVPMALAARGILADRGFRIAVGVVVAYWLYNLSGTWGWHRLPIIPNSVKLEDFYKILHMESDGATKYIMTDHWSNLRFRPVVMGIAFLLTLEMGFSVWSGFWLMVVLCGWLYAAGVEVSLETQGRTFGCGATLAMAGVIVWIGRHHYLALAKGAIGLGAAGGDRVGVWGLRALVVGVLGMGACIMWMGGGWAAALIGTLFILAFLLVMARVVAESGLPFFQAAHDFAALSNSLGLPMLMPYQALIGMLWLGTTMMYDTRENIGVFAAQGAGIGESARMPMGRLLVGLGLLAAVAAIVAVVSGLVQTWTGDGTALPKPQLRTGDVANLASKALSDPRGAGAAWWATFSASPVLYGAGVLLLLVAIRRLWTSCPFHPLGLVVATSYPVWIIWFSLFFGWIAKVLVLRYGGSQLYARLKPVAIGLIVGDLLGYAVQFICVAASRASGGTPLTVWLAPFG